MDFKALYAIYKDNLPTMEVFFNDGKHSITPKDVAKHYGVRRVHSIWDKFVTDYKANAPKPVTKTPPKKTVAVKSATTKES